MGERGCDRNAGPETDVRGGNVGKVIYVTGAPATGKSTLCSALAADPRVQTFCYSERLRDHVNRQCGANLDEVAIRRESAQVVTSKHVDEVDEMLQAEADTSRVDGNYLLIDSHPVTKEAYGFRVTPFKLQRLLDLRIDRLVCLYADPAVLEDRIRRDPQGRPLPTRFELSMHVQLQAAVLSTYSILAANPCHLVDSSLEPEALARQVRKLVGLT